MLTALWYHDGRLDEVGQERVPELLAEPSGFLWVDALDPGPDELEALEQIFQFHPLALEDVRKRQQRPKVDRYAGYEFLVLYDVGCVNKDHILTRTQVSLFVSPSYLVSIHPAPVPPLADFRERWRAYPEMVEPHPPGFALYHILDGLVDGLFPIADQVEEWIDQLEDQIFGETSPRMLGYLLRVREAIIQLRQIASSERDVLNALIRRDHPIFHDTTAVFYNDVYDHLLRVVETMDIQRDVLTGTLDAYLSLQSNRLNVVVKRLTGLTLVLMVITLVTGFFGMNVGFLGRDEPLGLVISVVAMFGLGIGAWALARKLDWL